MGKAMQVVMTLNTRNPTSYDNNQKKQPHPHGFSYEIENHEDYVKELEASGIPPPKARYRVVSPTHIDDAVIQFFRLDGIEYKITPL